ncbi:zinc finger protein weckle-like [Anastrepha obliqua]|uniref:zinc finger protein weckle-like n=1 Tax=Anastrepha obliqua TaxID=95512 RepID=UPI00240A1EF9|nr:zinc finger protein weckle-like [Anastrepha obliqua]
MDNVENEWKLWCRLCAKADVQNINLFSDSIPTSNSNTINFIAAINEYFHVQIIQEGNLPQVVCTQCLLMVTSLVEFAARISKVQKMYNTLKNRKEITELDLGIFAQKYDALNEDPVETDPLTMTNKFYTPTAIENQLSCNLPPFLNTVSSEVQNELICDKQADRLNEKFNKINKSKGDFVQHSESSGYKLPSSSAMIEAPVNVKSNENTIALKKLHNKKFQNVNSCVNSDMSEKRLASSNKNRNKSKYLCSHCPQRFQRISSYRLHIKKKHGKIEKDAPLVEKQVYTCPNCELMFPRRALRTQHVKSVHGDKSAFICEKCGEIMGSKTALRDHMLTHSNYAPFECKVCGKCFKQKKRLKIHMDIHGDKHICNECGLQLSSRSTLYFHSMVHSDAMPHKCDYCGRAFKRAKTLKNHLILHTGLKPYSCDFCDKTFSNTTSCRTHKKNLHAEEFAAQEASGEKPPKARNIPTLAVLKAITRTANNLTPVAPKQSGNFSCGKKRTLDERNSNLMSKMCKHDSTEFAATNNAVINATLANTFVSNTECNSTN